MDTETIKRLTPARDCTDQGGCTCAANILVPVQEKKEGDCCGGCVCGSCTSAATAVLPPLQSNSKMKPREEVMAYAFPSLVKRLEKELGLTQDEAQELYLSTLQFLFLAALWKGKKSFFPPGMIDKAWHEFVVHTMDYYKFCMINFGFFLHHVPFNDENKDLQRQVESARPQALLHFGELSKFWKESGKADAICTCQGNCGCPVQ